MWNSNISYQILLAEDDVMMRNAVRSMLQSKGFQVLVAANGYEALELSRTHEGTIELLLCATTILSNSASALRRIRSQRPNTHMLFISGRVEESGLPESGPFLAKPFPMEVLLERIEGIRALSLPAT